MTDKLARKKGFADGKAGLGPEDNPYGPEDKKAYSAWARGRDDGEMERQEANGDPD